MSDKGAWPPEHGVASGRPVKSSDGGLSWRRDRAGCSAGAVLGISYQSNDRGPVVLLEAEKPAHIAAMVTADRGSNRVELCYLHYCPDGMWLWYSVAERWETSTVIPLVCSSEKPAGILKVRIILAVAGTLRCLETHSREERLSAGSRFLEGRPQCVTAQHSHTE
jgi:hypothetical protein